MSGSEDKSTHSTEPATSQPYKAEDVESAKPQPWDPTQFPDGGLKAWLVVAGAFCFVFASFGWINCIGIFQTYYQTTLLKSYSPDTIAWIASLELFIMFFGGLIIGRLYDVYGPRWILLVGSVLHILGLMMLSLSTEYYQIFLCQGIVSAVGISCLFNPAINCVTTWFFKHRGTAVGIVASGSSLGGVILPIMFSRLQAQYGFPWAIRICAFFLLGLLVIGNLVTVARFPPSPRPVTLRNYFKPLTEVPYLTMTAAFFFFYLGLFLPINYIEVQALQFGMTPSLASYLIPILNGASMFGRILPGYVGDRVGRFNTVTVMAFGSGISILALWLPAQGNAPLIVFAALYGFFSGAGVSLIAAMVAQISDIKEIGLRIGLEFAVLSIPALVSNPIGGALVNHDDGGFRSCQIFAGVVIMIGGCLFIVSRLTQSGMKLKAIY